MRKLITVNSDSGHAWAEVPVSELIDLGINDKITSYSYLSFDGKTAYVEEDYDATIYVNALKDAGYTQENMSFVHKYVDLHSFVRNLPSYKNHLTNQ